MKGPRTPISPRRTGVRQGRVRTRTPAAPGGRRRTLLATAALLGALGLFAGIAVVAWRSLPALPAVEEMRAASAAAAGAPLARMLPRAEGEDRRRVATAPVVLRDPAAGGLERLPAKPAPLAPAASVRPERFKLVIIDSAGEINVRSRTLRLAYVDPPEPGERCTNASGKEWPCGARARTALRRLVRARALECRHRPAEEGVAASAPAAASAARAAAAPAARDLAPDSAPDVATCAVGGVDLSRWLVENGWASPAADAPAEYAALHEKAKASKVGLFEPAAR